MERVTVSIPAISLKPIVAVHFILTVWGCQPFHAAFAYSNFLVLGVGVWAIASFESTDAVQMFLIGLLFTILNDIIILGVFYKETSYSYWRFCNGMAILSLILKPFSCILTFQQYRNRGGEVDYRWTGNPYVTIEGNQTDGSTATGYQSQPQS